MSVCVPLPYKVISSPTHRQVVHRPAQVVRSPSSSVVHTLPSERSVRAPSSLPALLTTQTVTLTPGQQVRSPTSASQPASSPLSPDRHSVTLSDTPCSPSIPGSIGQLSLGPFSLEDLSSPVSQPCSPTTRVDRPRTPVSPRARPHSLSVLELPISPSSSIELSPCSLSPRQYSYSISSLDRSPSVEGAVSKLKQVSCAKHSPSVNQTSTLNKTIKKPTAKRTVCSTAQHQMPATKRLEHGACGSTQKHKVVATKTVGQGNSAQKHAVSGTRHSRQGASGSQSRVVVHSPDAPPVYCTTAVTQVGSVPPQAERPESPQITHTSTHIIPAVNQRRKFSVVSVQRLDLQKNNADDPEPVRGQIVISLISRDRGNTGTGPAVTNSTHISNNIPPDPNELPDG